MSNSKLYSDNDKRLLKTLAKVGQTDHDAEHDKYLLKLQAMQADYLSSTSKPSLRDDQRPQFTFVKFLMGLIFFCVDFFFNFCL